MFSLYLLGLHPTSLVTPLINGKGKLIDSSVSDILQSFDFLRLAESETLRMSASFCADRALNAEKN